MKNLRLTQKSSKDATEKTVWTLTDFDSVNDLQTSIVDNSDNGIDFVADCFWTGFKLVTRSKTGFNEALKKLDISFEVTTEKVVKSKESDADILARMLGIKPEDITPELIEKMKELI